MCSSSRCVGFAMLLFTANSFWKLLETHKLGNMLSLLNMCTYIYIYHIHVCIYVYVYLYIYIYQHMPRGVIMAPLREGVSKWRPFISKVFLNLFGVIWDIHFIFVIWGHGSSAFEFFFWHPKNGACQTCHLRVGWMWRGCQNATPLG